MNPTRRLAITGVALAATAGVLAIVATSNAPRADARPRVERLIAPEESASWTVAALTITRPDEIPLVYGRIGGRWRLSSRGGALAEAGAVERLIQSLFEAQAAPRPSSARPEDYGLVRAPSVRIELHGPRILARPDRDVLFGLDVGAHVPGRNLSFARRTDRNEIVALQLDLAERLGQVSDLPPMLETRVVPSDFVGQDDGLIEIVVERADGQGMKAEFEPAMGPLAGEPTWRMIPQGRRSPRAAESGLASLYARFLLRAPFQALVDPSTIDPASLEAPEARLLLHSTSSAEPLELILLRPLPDGRRIVVQARDRLALAVEPALAEVFAARSEHLVDIRTTPPWDRWLRLELPPDFAGGR